MRMRNRFSLAFLLIGTTTALAGRQQEGMSLISDAVDIANIRSTGASPFRLEASFHNLGTSASENGTYVETWLSADRWREDTAKGGFHRTEIGILETKWVPDSFNSITKELSELVSTVDLRNWKPSSDLKVTKILSKQIGAAQARCVQWEGSYVKTLQCFDTKNNTLLLHESMSGIDKSTHFSCSYDDYEKFGDHLFPRLLTYQREGKPPVEIRISSLTAGPSPDPAIFVPTPGSVALANCLRSEMTAPRARLSSDPTFPPGERAQNAFVVLRLVVGIDGIPSHVYVAQSGGDAFDAEAVRAISGWRFKSASCHDHPVATEINVEVRFRR